MSLFILLMVAAGLYLYPLNDLLHDFDDSTQYILLAESLAEGEGYKDIHLPHEPPHTSYPPLFPTLLAPWAWGFGSNLYALKLPGILSALGIFIITWFWIFRLSGWVWASLGTLFVVSSPHLLLSSHKILSEPTFAFFVILSLFLATNPKPKGWAIGLACAGAFLTRKVGIVVIPAITLVWLFSPIHRPQFKNLLLPFLLTSCIPISLWVLRSHWAGGALSELQFFVSGSGRNVFDSPGYLLANIRYNPIMLGQVVLPPLAETLFVNRWLAIFPLGLLGSSLVLAWRRKERIPVLFLLFYGFTIMLWPWTSYRFWIPLFPLAVVLLVLLLSSLPARRVALIGFGLLVAFQLPLTLGLAREIHSGVDHVPPYAAPYLYGLRKSVSHLPEKTILAAPGARLAAYLTRKKVVPYRINRQNPASLLDYLRHWKVEFLVYEPQYMNVLVGHSVSDPGRLLSDCFEERFREGKFILYEVSDDC